ncbi:hypothetical protein [Paenibacillus sp. GP183]|uniref:hypothetical protein n=1 Tax=Paenibacillus sp. GP183 TaxID=1882751 RepID=UPI00089A02E9|nr:hypothetical protein [Paenibacillus sp. GP183]SEC70544.1 hypothetical protein SAMN05443246_5070 [Paenibacillus sp. GP183]
MSSKKRTVSSGILNNIGTNFAVNAIITAENADPDDDRIVTVEVIDWTNPFPVQLPVASFNGPNGTPGDNGPIEIEESTAAIFFADVTPAFLYEVRITYHNTTEDFITNAFGTDFFFNNLEGFTVLHSEFKTIELD